MAAITQRMADPPSWAVQRARVFPTVEIAWAQTDSAGWVTCAARDHGLGLEVATTAMGVTAAIDKALAMLDECRERVDATAARSLHSPHCSCSSRHCYWSSRNRKLGRPLRPPHFREPGE